MRTQLAIAGAVVAVATLGATAPSAVQAAGQITGHDIKNDSVTGKDVKEASLRQVPSARSADTATTAGSATTATTAGSATTAKTADVATTARGLSTAASGKTMSGVFTAAGDAPNGYLGVAITYPQPLAAPIANNHVIDTAATPNPALCPGAGQAAPGYLCLYLHQRFSITALTTFVYSTGTPPYNAPGLAGTSVGAALYANVTGASPYADGVWTVTAP